MRPPAELTLAGEDRRGHGSLYAALNHGRIEVDRLRTAQATVPVPRAADGRIVFAVDVTCWLRPEAHTVPQRVLRHTDRVARYGARSVKRFTDRRNSLTGSGLR
jgi:hypothetical protein